MQNLVQFLIRNGVFFLFLGLELLCIYLVVQTNQRQNSIYQKASLTATAAINARYKDFVNYGNLRGVADSLLAENARLREFQHNLGPSGGSAGDSSISSYVIHPARVIKNSISGSSNYLVLDRGASNGLKAGMGVSSDNGIVGVIVSTTAHYAKVMSILHRNTMISTSVRHSGYFGSLVWNGGDPRSMRLEAIPKHANLSGGDSVVTSGYSYIFPPDILIGTIDTFSLSRGSNFYDINVDLKVDIGKINAVYVIENLRKKEQVQLESNPDQ